MKLLLHLFFIVGILAFLHTAQAQISGRIWDGGAGASQSASDGRNWDGDLLPTAGDSITLPAGFAVLWDSAGVTPGTLTSSAGLTLAQPLNISGNLTVNNGTLQVNGSALTVGGAVTLNGGVLDGGAGAINVSGNWTFSGGDALLAGSTVTFTGSAAKTITSAGKHFSNITINASGSSVALIDPLIADGTVTVGAGTLSVGSSSLSSSGGVMVTGGTLDIGTGTLILTGTVGKPLNITSGTFTSGTTGTVEYKPVGGGVTVAPATYGNLTLSGNATFSLSGATTVTGGLTIGAGTSLSVGGYTLAVPSGVLVNSGTIISGSTIKIPSRSLRVTDGSGVEVTKINTSSGTIVVRVEDYNQNQKGTAVETAQGITITTLSGDKELMAGSETGNATALFVTAPVVVHQGAVSQGNGQVEVTQNDIVFLTYTDPTDPTDTRSAQVAVALSGAVLAGTPQVVSGPAVTEFSAQTSGSGTTYTAHFVWTTDRESTSSVAVTSSTLVSPLAGGSLTGVMTHDVAIAGLKRGTTYSYTITSVTADGKSVTTTPKTFVVVVDGDRIKTATSPAVYWYLNNTRNVFADIISYDSWFPDFNNIVTIPAGQMSDTPLGKVVPVRGGTYLIKIQSDPKVYAVEPLGGLRWIPTEATALALYGSNWAKRVRDVDVSQFVSYTIGESLAPGKVPESFFYEIANGGWNTFAANVTHALTDTSRSVNGVQARFVSAVTPATVAGLNSGATYFGYAPDINGVYKNGGIQVMAPAFP